MTLKIGSPFMSRLSSSCWRRSFMDSRFKSRSSCCLRVLVVVCITLKVLVSWNMPNEKHPSSMLVGAMILYSRLRSQVLVNLAFCFLLFWFAVPNLFYHVLPRRHFFASFWSLQVVLVVSPVVAGRGNQFGFLFGFNQFLLVRIRPLTEPILWI